MPEVKDSCRTPRPTERNPRGRSTRWEDRGVAGDIASTAGTISWANTPRSPDPRSQEHRAIRLPVGNLSVDLSGGKDEVADETEYCVKRDMPLPWKEDVSIRHSTASGCGQFNW